VNIEALFSTGKRLRILGAIIYSMGQLRVNRTAGDLGLSKGLVSKYFDLLVKQGILRKVGAYFEVRDGVETRAVRILLNLSRFDTGFFGRYGFVRGVGLYGSCARGTNTVDSDVDLWLFVEEVAEEVLASLTSELKRVFGDVRPLYLTEKKIELLKRENPTFYCSIVFGSIMVWGEEIEAI